MESYSTAVYLVLHITNLADHLIFILVKFIPDVAYDLLDQVLHSHQAGSASVLVQDDGKADGLAAHGFHEDGGFLEFIGKEGLAHDRTGHAWLRR